MSSSQSAISGPSARAVHVEGKSVEPISARRIANVALTAATRLWFGVAITGQLIFVFTVASFYGMATLRGDLRAWNRGMVHGYRAGDPIGNFAVAVHLLSAVVIMLAGIVQLIPAIRERAPVLHRWNGRLYVLSAFSISLAGLHMMWVRGTVGDLSQHLGQSLNAVLIMISAAMALRYALARDFKTHRRWALRLYLLVSASLFIRAALFLSFVLNHGPFGFDPATFSGPFLTFISFAQYLVPLALLEIYFRLQERPGAAGRFVMATVLFALSLGLGAGVFVVSMGQWMPRIKKAYDSRKSIADTLSATIASSGIDEAVMKYHTLRSFSAAAYNFDESELNSLGYQLIQSQKVKEAIRIFQLNIEAYPRSSNTYDSLGEAYMDDSNNPLAIANYRKSLELDPKNRDAAMMLRKLAAR
jgi:tetratricopeptide (TPR) repeat protein